MAIVSIKNCYGSFVGVGPDGRAGTSHFHYLFDMRRADGGFTFRLIGSHFHLAVADDGHAIVARECEAAAADVFSANVEEAGFVALRSPRGGALSLGEDGVLTAGGEDVTRRALFRIEAQPFGAEAEKMFETGHGHGPSRDEKWEEQTHADIVSYAFDIILERHKQRRYANVFLTRLWNKTAFRNGVFKGLKDADDLVYYNQGKLFFWHFYDPDTDASYGPIGRLGPNAKTCGAYYFSRSLVAAVPLVRSESHEDITYFKCGYDLGLALHFLTDVTQPMHAANFTYADSPVGIHGDFEKFVDQNREIILHHAQPVSEAQLQQIEKVVQDGTFDVATYYIDVAKASKAVWTGMLKPWIDLHGNRFTMTNNDLVKALDGSIRLAPSYTARLAFAYVGMAIVNTTLVDETNWYTIQEHTKGELMSWVSQFLGPLERVRRWERGLPDGRHEFCFVPDGKGYYRIVGKRDIDWAWRMDEDDTYWYADMSKVENAKENAFYLEHAGTVNGQKRIRIIEPTRFETITVSWGGLDTNGRALRWGDVNDPQVRQSFTFQVSGKMTETEHHKIADLWRKKIRQGG